MGEDRDEQIRKRAYRLWEEAGRPEGQHDAHWTQAAGEAGSGDGGGRGQDDDKASVDQLTPAEAAVTVTTAAPPRSGSDPEAKSRKPL